MARQTPFEPTATGPSGRCFGPTYQFIETGRANPSTQMVAKLAKSLKMPMQDAIQAYLAAGFAPVFMQHPRTQADMTRIEQAIQTVLQNHRQGLPGAA